MKKTIKFLMIILCILTIFCTFNNSFVYAIDPDVSIEKKGESPKVSGDNWDVSEKFDTGDWNPTSSTAHEEEKLAEIGNKIVGTLQAIGSVVSVVAIMIIGIRYMVCSVEEKAQYKETMWPYLIGAVLVFGITTTLKIVYDIAQSLN